MNPIDDFFNSITALPSLPKVVLEVMEMLGQEDVALNALARKVEHDTVIAAKVLKMANSSYYGATRAIKTVDDAIAILGLSKLRTLVVASGITASVPAQPELDLQGFWKHSLVTAGISREIAGELEQNVELAYLVGLLHNIGGLLIQMVFPKISAEVKLAYADSSAEERQRIEHEAIGLDHCQISEELANRWNFPREISRILRYYATPFDKSAGELAPVVYLAAHIAGGLERGDSAEAILQSLNADVAHALSINATGWDERITAYQALVQEAEALL